MPSIVTEKLLDCMNVERKTQYLKDLTLQEKSAVYISTFRGALVSVEPALKIDICDMNTEQAADALVLACGYRVDAMSNVRKAFQDYVAWCRSMGYSVRDPNGFDLIRTRGVKLDRAVQNSINTDENELVEIIRCVEKPDDMSRAGAVMCLLWMGFEPEEIPLIRDDEVDFLSGKIRDRLIPEEFVAILREYQEVSSSERSAWNGATIPLHKIQRGYFICQTNKKADTKPFVSPKQLSTDVIKISDDYSALVKGGKTFTAKNISDSGHLRRLYLLHDDHRITSEEIIAEFADKNMTYSRIRTVQQVYESYLRILE